MKLSRWGEMNNLRYSFVGPSIRHEFDDFLISQVLQCLTKFFLDEIILGICPREVVLKFVNLLQLKCLTHPPTLSDNFSQFVVPGQMIGQLLELGLGR